jgi:DNA-directed RNA polymerase specialized sigma24 family protein
MLTANCIVLYTVLVALRRTGPKQITVHYEHNGSGWQARARIEGKDVVVAARTLDAARSAMATEAAPLLNTYPSNVPLKDAVALPEECMSAITIAREARVAAAEATARSQETLRAAAQLLVREHGLSYRDAAFALGVSHPRIQQVLGKE